MFHRESLAVGRLLLLLVSGCATAPLPPPAEAPPPAPPPPVAAPAPEAPPPAPPPGMPPPVLTQVSGSVSYLERVALTPEAVVRVEVVREGPGAGELRVVGEQTLRTPGQVPIAFAVTLAPEAVEPTASYFLRASIADGERNFATREPVPVLTHGHPSQDVRVRVGVSAKR